MIFCLKNLFSSLMRVKDAKASKPAAIGVIRVDVVLRAMRKHATNPEARPPPPGPCLVEVLGDSDSPARAARAG